jgi:hypothetical protein
MSAPTPDIVQPEIGHPCSARHPEHNRGKAKATIVGREPSNQRCRLLGDDTGDCERDVRPEPVQKVERRRLRGCGLQQPENNGRSPFWFRYACIGTEPAPARIGQEASM